LHRLFCSFQSSYPSWEPNIHGKQFLLNLRTFRDQKLQGQGVRHVYSPRRMWRGSPSYRGPGDRNIPFSREMPFNTPGFQLGSLWLLDIDQRNHPYLLDCYYTSRPHTSTDNTRDATAVPFEAAEQQHSRDYWMPSNLTQNEARYDEELWGHNYQDRSVSHLGASTSAPFFQESVLQHHDSSNVAHPTRSHWWARSVPRDAQPQASFLEPPGFHQASFLEPPDFNRYASENYHDNFSERSLEEQEQHLDWRNSNGLSRTTYLDDDIDAGRSVSLHFDDIYSRPPETPPAFRDPPTF